MSIGSIGGRGSVGPSEVVGGDVPAGGPSRWSAGWSSVGVDLEKKRKLLLYPIEYQRGFRCEWVLGFAKTAVIRAGSNMGLVRLKRT